MRLQWYDIIKSKLYLLLLGAWLITISFIIRYWSEYHSSTTQFAATLEAAIHRKEIRFQQLISDSSLLHRLSTGQYSGADLDPFQEQPFFFFLYSYDVNGNLQLRFWNTQAVQPDWQMLYAGDNRMLMNYSNAHYELIRQTITLQHRQLLAIALIPVKYEYFVANNYLTNDFTDQPGEYYRSLYSITLQGPGEPVVSSKGNTLFYVSRNRNIQLQAETPMALLLRITGLFLIMAWVHSLVVLVRDKSGKTASFVFLVASLLLIKLLFYFTVYPFEFSKYELFDPSLFSGSVFAATFGDFIVNLLLMMWLLVYTDSLLRAGEGKILLRDQQKYRLLWLLLPAAAFCMAGIAASHLILQLSAQPKISLDVNNFFSLTLNSLTAFVVLGMICLLFFYFSRIIYSCWGRFIDESGVFFYLAVVFWGLLYLSLRSKNGYYLLEFYALVWLVLYLGMNRLLKTISVKQVHTLSGYLFWVFIFSSSIAGALLQQNSEVQMEERKMIAENLARQSDPENESLLRIAFSSFSTDFFRSNFDRFRNDSVAGTVKDSLIKDIFRGYLNRYDTRIYLYTATSKPLSGYEEVSMDTLNAILINQAQRTQIPGLFYYQSALDQFSYLSRKEVRDFSGLLMGYVFIISTPKKYKSEALYPELFKQRTESNTDKSASYAYAVYDRLQLQQRNKDYPFAASLTKDELPVTTFETRYRKDDEELWFKSVNNKIVIIATPKTGLTTWVSLLAYLFCIFLVTLVTSYLLAAFFKTGFRWNEFRMFLGMNIRTQIQGTIILASLLSFFVIGFVTIRLFAQRYERNNRDRLGRIMSIVKDQMRNDLVPYRIHGDSLQLNDNVNPELQSRVASLAEIYNTEINLYDPEGNLKVSSQPFIYNRGILSEKMNPEAYYHLRKLREVQMIQTEHIGKLEYFSIYSPLKDAKGKLYGFLNIPYFSSQTELKQEISNFLVTLININAFIFLIAGAFAFFITNRITDSFSLIAEKMQAVNLGRVNEVISWKRNDEIGGLVKEYNKMVYQLEQSAEILAKTEREGAWREMARQVAHEIKNPLTPMKLSIQYLEKAMKENPSNIKELASRVTQTLVEQIDHLSKIASDFSQFANIGNPKNETFDLHTVLSSLSNLYLALDHIHFSWQQVDEPLMIHADRTQVNRLFTNLLQNAVQAVPPGIIPQINVKEELVNRSIIVSITDNGLGIPDEIKPGIFTPNFTTKTSGTGLGLAMCKGIVEQAGGQIWFETEVSKGTTFFVLLPLV